MKPPFSLGLRSASWPVWVLKRERKGLSKIFSVAHREEGGCWKGDREYWGLTQQDFELMYDLNA